MNSLVGWVAERFNAPVLKTGDVVRRPWVRIPPHPLNLHKSLRNQAFFFWTTHVWGYPGPRWAHRRRTRTEAEVCRLEHTPHANSRPHRPCAGSVNLARQLKP